MKLRLWKRAFDSGKKIAVRPNVDGKHVANCERNKNFVARFWICNKKHEKRNKKNRYKTQAGRKMFVGACTVELSS